MGHVVKGNDLGGAIEHERHISFGFVERSLDLLARGDVAEVDGKAAVLLDPFFIDVLCVGALKSAHLRPDIEGHCLPKGWSAHLVAAVNS
jgi:hypothetical protein